VACVVSPATPPVHGRDGAGEWEGRGGMDHSDLAVIAERLTIVERNAEGRGRSRRAERFVYAAYPSLDVRHAVYRIHDSFAVQREEWREGDGYLKVGRHVWWDTEQQARAAADRCATGGSDE
jgi:hypothetical protein